MSAQTITVLASVSSALGFLTLLAYFYLVSQFRRAERSVRETVEGEGLFNSGQVLEILKQFSDDEARLKALAHLTSLDQNKAKAILHKIKSGVDVGQLQRLTYRHFISWAGLIGIVLLLLGLLGMFVPRENKSLDTPERSPTSFDLASTPNVAETPPVTPQDGTHNCLATVTSSRKPQVKDPGEFCWLNLEFGSATPITFHEKVLVTYLLDGGSDVYFYLADAGKTLKGVTAATIRPWPLVISKGGYDGVKQLEIDFHTERDICLRDENNNRRPLTSSCN